MDEILRQQIEAVCRDSPKPTLRRKALHRLILELQQFPELRKSYHPDYLEALNRTWEWLAKNICEQFSLTKESVRERLIQWINSYLYWRIKDLYPPDPNAPLPLPNHELGIPTRGGLDHLIDQLEQTEIQNVGEQLEQYIETDPEGQLKSCYPQNYPDCHAQFLAQRLLLQSPPDKMSQIAKELEINYQTLQSHWKRRCLPLLQAIATQLGYQNS